MTIVLVLFSTMKYIEMHVKMTIEKDWTMQQGWYRFVAVATC